MADASKPADALYIPTQLIAGKGLSERAPEIARVAKPLLGLGANDPVHIEGMQQNEAGCFHFVRKRLDDTKLFPKTHPRHPEERHEWVDGPDGIRLGYSRGD